MKTHDRERFSYALMASVSKFWTRVRVAEGDGCWEWLGGCNDDGYGIFHFGGDKVYAHRFSWIASFGRLPKFVESGGQQYQLVVCHRCDNRKCVRPDHLFLGTMSDNNTDRALKQRARTIVTPLAERPMTAEERERRREIMLQLVQLRYPARFVARIFNVHHRTVQNSVKKPAQQRLSRQSDDRLAAAS